MTTQPRLGIVGDNGSGHAPNPLASRDAWRLRLKADGFERDYSLADLAALEFSHLDLPIECVSAGFIAGKGVPMRFGGLPFTRLVQEIGDTTPYQTVIFRSRARATCGPKHLAHETSLELDYCLNSGHVMLAWELNGAELPYANGWPLRSTVGPERYFYKSVKWLGEIELTRRPMEACRGTWETYAGYHNLGRTAKVEKFTPIMRRITGLAEDGSDISSEVPPEQWQSCLDALVAQRDFSRLILAKVEYMKINLPKDFSEFRFRDGHFIAKLRGCKFSKCSFAGADMRGVNLSLSKLLRCDLQGTDLTDIDAEGADFSGSDLTGATMVNGYLTGARFYPQKALDAGVKPAEPAKVQGLNLARARNLDPLQAAWLRADGANIPED